MKIPKGCKVYSVWVVSNDDGNFIIRSQIDGVVYQFGISNTYKFTGTPRSAYIYFEGYLLARSKEHAKERIYHKFLQLFDGNMGKWEKVLLGILEEL